MLSTSDVLFPDQTHAGPCSGRLYNPTRLGSLSPSVSKAVTDPKENGEALVLCEKYTKRTGQGHGSSGEPNSASCSKPEALPTRPCQTSVCVCVCVSYQGKPSLVWVAHAMNHVWSTLTFACDVLGAERQLATATLWRTFASPQPGV